MNLSGYTRIAGEVIADSTIWSDGSIQTPVAAHFCTGIIENNLQFKRDVVTVLSKAPHKKGNVIDVSGYLSTRSYKPKGSQTYTLSIQIKEMEEIVS